MKHAWISEHRDSFPVALLCEVLDVSTSGYYASTGREPSEPAQRHKRIKAAVAQVHAQSHGIYGSLKIAQALQQATIWSRRAATRWRPRCEKWASQPSSQGNSLRPPPKSIPTKRPAPNRLDRDFTAAAPIASGSPTSRYLATAQGWAYLAVVLDLFSRKVVGWTIGHSLATELVSAALRAAIEHAGRPAKNCCTTATAARSTRATLTNRP